jgi:hypothetical protein
VYVAGEPVKKPVEQLQVPWQRRRAKALVTTLSKGAVNDDRSKSSQSYDVDELRRFFMSE